MKYSKEELRQLRAENRDYSSILAEIPRDQWRPSIVDHTAQWRNKVWRSRHFLVQEFVEPDGMIRLTVNRTDVDRDGNWKQDITWDDLQDIKNAVGYHDHAAIEVFPPAAHCVNVANMRHLWLCKQQQPMMVPIWGVNR